MGEIMVPMQFFKGNMPPGAMAFTAFWLVGWTIGGGFAMYVWAWQLAGREVITLDTRTLTTKRHVKGIGRSHEFDVAHVSNLRVSLQTFNMFDMSAGFANSMAFWGLGGGTIAFDYGAKTFRFGNGVDEAEARHLVEALNKVLPASKAG